MDCLSTVQKFKFFDKLNVELRKQKMLRKPDPEVGDSILLLFPISLFKVAESQNLKELSRNPYIKVSFFPSAIVNLDCGNLDCLSQ